MEIMLVLFGPMVVAFVVLTLAPANATYLWLLGIAVVGTGALALAPTLPSSGPDDWFNGIGRASGLMGLFGATATLPAQVARRLVPLGTGAYIGAIVATLAVAAVVPVIFWGG